MCALKRVLFFSITLLISLLIVRAPILRFYTFLSKFTCVSRREPTVKITIYSVLEGREVFEKSSPPRVGEQTIAKKRSKFHVVLRHCGYKNAVFFVNILRKISISISFQDHFFTPHSGQSMYWLGIYAKQSCPTSKVWAALFLSNTVKISEQMKKWFSFNIVMILFAGRSNGWQNFLWWGRCQRWTLISWN